MKKSLVPLLLVLASLTACKNVGVQPATKAPQILTIGAWNMEWLGNTNRRSDQPDPQVVANYIRNSHAQVLGLEEICETQPGTLKNVILEQTVALLSTNGTHWQYRMFDSHTERGQNTGVMWNADAVSASDSFEIPVDHAESSMHLKKWDRAPYATQFSTGKDKTDFVLIPVHMKSNIGGGTTIPHRDEEAKALVAALPKVEEHFRGSKDLERDIVIVGDFNTMKHTEDCIATYEAAGFIDLNPQDILTEKSRRYAPAPFDRALVPASQPEFQSRKFAMAEDGFVDGLSDHHLVTTEISISRDDD
ncbi:MAG: endonuclease/exonuclease/phosphatase family protein [Limisphaerales bacterium]